MSKSQLSNLLKLLPYLPALAWVVLALGVGLLGFMSTPFEKERLKLADSPAKASQFLITAKAAANEGDYMLAKQLYQTGMDAGFDEAVLGSQTEIIETVFPEVKLEARLLEIEAILTKQPTYVDGLIEKTWVLYRLRLDDEARNTFETVKMIDPNNKNLKVLEEALGI